MLDVLYKKAKGYEVEETTVEYGFDEEGNRRVLKEKTSTKYVPPDLSAIKAYMELKDGELYDMTDEELKEERKKLLKELKNIQKPSTKKRENNTKEKKNDEEKNVEDQ